MQIGMNSPHYQSFYPLYQNQNNMELLNCQIKTIYNSSTEIKDSSSPDFCKKEEISNQPTDFSVDKYFDF